MAVNRGQIYINIELLLLLLLRFGRERIKEDIAAVNGPEFSFGSSGPISTNSLY